MVARSKNAASADIDVRAGDLDDIDRVLADEPSRRIAPGSVGGSSSHLLTTGLSGAEPTKGTTMKMILRTLKVVAVVVVSGLALVGGWRGDVRRVTGDLTINEREAFKAGTVYCRRAADMAKIQRLEVVNFEDSDRRFAGNADREPVSGYAPPPSSTVFGRGNESSRRGN